MPNHFDHPRRPKPTYIGRFAPSPTGLLHFGSLVTALASYLDAHHNQGQWLVRMEDIDPPREQAGAAAAILRSLEDHGLQWDDKVIYQSQRLEFYAHYLAQLKALNLIYPCNCSRQVLATRAGIYNGHCRAKSIDVTQPHALRLKVYDLPIKPTPLERSDLLTFIDLIQGLQQQNLRNEVGDQVLKRKDGLFAYQLAVVVDDIEQHITHVIRGSDLLDVTARQILLFQLLQTPAPEFGHVTLATYSTGQKLSKQNLAPPLQSVDAGANLWKALTFLGQNPPQELYGARPNELLEWGKQNWGLAKIKALRASIE